MKEITGICIIKTWKVDLDFIKKIWKNKDQFKEFRTGCPFFTRIDNSFFINFADVAGV